MAVVLTAACTTSVTGSGHGAATTRPAPTAAGRPSRSASDIPAPGPALANACGPYAAPDAHRPHVALSFTLSADHATVTGTEQVSFTPDLDVDQLVFRLTANTAPTVAEGNRVQVTSARADHGGGTPTYDRAGADPSTQGGLLRIPFATPVQAGTTVTADLAFTVTLGAGSFDRFGRQDGYAWWGSAQPLLAWERGHGWHDEPMIAFTAESATSEAMDTSLTVTAPAADTVVMSGNPTTAAPGSGGAGGTRTWRGTLAAARDVAVAAGPFAVSDSTVDVGGGHTVALRIGGTSQARVDALRPEFQRALTQLSADWGPFPFPSLAVAQLPASGGGIEYPGAILMLDGSRLVAVHETAHQWFYGMVGDSQAQHAWLDEAFASFAEQVVDGDPPPAGLLTSDPDPVDKPTADWGDDEAGYYTTTYDKGSAALFAARQAVGADAFDGAIRCYVAHNAWRIAQPDDFASALQALPAAVAVLRQAGALP